MADASPFTLSVTQEVAPLLTNAVYVRDPAETSLGVLIQGNNPAQIPTLFRLIYDAAGERLGGSTAPFDSFDQQANVISKALSPLIYPENSQVCGVETRGSSQWSRYEPLDAVAAQPQEVAQGRLATRHHSVCGGHPMR